MPVHPRLDYRLRIQENTLTQRLTREDGRKAISAQEQHLQRLWGREEFDVLKKQTEQGVAKSRWEPMCVSGCVRFQVSPVA
jgi:hypothetical protein